jgi:integrase
VRPGKGDKDRTTYLDDGAVADLTDWLALRGDQPGALFHPTVKGGRISPRRMSDQAVLDILRQLREQAQEQLYPMFQKGRVELDRFCKLIIQCFEINFMRLKQVSPNRLISVSQSD